MNLTEHYSLQKPISEEKYNVNVTNMNMDLIDSALNRIEMQNQTQDNLLATKEALDSEIARATEKENELLENINAETTRAENAETEILNQLDSEITRAMQAEDIISNSLEDHTTSSLAHNDIRLLISGLTTRLNSLADSDDTTLDQLSEIVAYIKNNKSLIDGITTSKVNVSDIIDNLTSTAVNKPLSAKQGKVLKDLINALTTAVGNKVDKVSGKGLSTNDYTTAEKNKLSGIASGAEVNVQPDWNTTDTTNDAYIKNKPTSLKNPNALTFTGGVTGSYDGSAAKSVAIPTSLPANGGTAETISKTLPISKGGTGQTTAKEAANGLIESLVVGQDGLAPGDTAMYLTYNGTEWVRRNIGTLVSYIKNKLERAFSLKKIYTINLSSYANTNFYLVTFNNTRNEIDCEIHSPTQDSAAAYNQNVLHFLLTRQGWNDTPKKLIILNHSVYSASEITIASVVSGNHNGTNGVYLRGGLTYEIYSNTPVALRTSQYTGGDEVFPSGTATCYKTGFTNVSVLIDFTANGNTGDFSKFEGELRAGSFTGNLTGNVTGNAASATKATQDGDGNVIADTYVSKNESRNVILLEYIAKNIITNNYISANSATLNNAILCGNNNLINETNTGAPAFNDAILGGQNNSIESGYSSVILGGAYNTIKESSSNSAIIAGNNIICLSYQIVTGHYNNESKTSDGSDSGTGTGTAFCIGNGSSTARSNAARIDYNGKLWCKSAYSATGADYAELFEWQDGNPNNEDRRGYFVTMDGDKIRKAQAGDWILGIVSANPCVLGNTDTEWQGQFLKDEFGAYLTEEFTETVTNTRYVPEVDEDGNPVLDENRAQTEVPEEYEEEITGTRYVLNPDYDPDAPYVDRMSRPEWNAVGMMGVLAVYDDGTCEVNGFCSCGADGIAAASDCGYRVVKRVTDNIVKVVFK